MLTAEQKEEIEYIKDRVLAKFPLLGVTMSKLEVEADDRVGTAMTTGEKIYYSPKYFNELSDDEEVFVFSHEVFHVAFEHIPRCKGHDMDLWNIATDAVINQLLKQEGLPIREGLVDIPDALGRSAEEMYKILWERREQKIKEWQEHIQEMMDKAKSMREEQEKNAEKERQQKQKREPMCEDRREQNSESQQDKGSDSSSSSGDSKSQQDKGADKGNPSEGSESQQDKGADKGNPSEGSESQATDKSAKQGETSEKSSQSQQTDEAKQNMPQNTGDNAQQGQPDGKNGSEQQGKPEGKSDDASQRDFGENGDNGQQGQPKQQSANGQQGQPEQQSADGQQGEAEQQNGGEQQGKPQEDEDPIDKWATQPPQMPELPEFKFNQSNHEIWKEVLSGKNPEKQFGQPFGQQQGAGDMGDMGDMGDIEKQFSHQNQREQAKQAMQYFGQAGHQHGYGSNGMGGGGSFHMGGDDWVGTKRAKELDWKKLLRRNIDAEFEAWSDRRAEEDNDFSSRLEEIEREDKAHTEVMLDISGSVDVNLLKEFLRQLKPLLKDSTLSVGYFNDSASDFTPVKTIKDIERLDIPEPDGGTNLDAAVRSFSKNKRTSKIVFTDGYGIMPGEDLKKTNVIWVVYDNDGRFSPCCGKVIYVDENRIMEEGQRRSFLISSAKGTSRK